MLGMRNTCIEDLSVTAPALPLSPNHFYKPGLSRPRAECSSCILSIKIDQRLISASKMIKTTICLFVNGVSRQGPDPTLQDAERGKGRKSKVRRGAIKKEKGRRKGKTKRNKGSTQERGQTEQ